MILTTEQQTLLRRMIKLFGQSAQWAQVIEECAELIVAIRHRDRGRVSDEAVAEEVADVFIMVAQAREMIGPDLVDSIMKEKLVRLQRRANFKEAHRKVRTPLFSTPDVCPSCGDKLLETPGREYKKRCRGCGFKVWP